MSAQSYEENDNAKEEQNKLRKYSRTKNGNENKKNENSGTEPFYIIILGAK